MESEITRLFLTYSAKKLRQMSQEITICTDKLTDEQIWSRSAPHENSIGNLILHLCGNARQWIISGVGGQPDIRNRDAEFSAKGGQTTGELNDHLKQTYESVIAVIESVSARRLTETIHPQNYTVSVLEAIYQVVGHAQQHAGQIIFATKIYTGQDLGLYRPPSPAQ